MKYLSLKYFNPINYIKKSKEIYSQIRVNYFGYVNQRKDSLDYNKYWDLRPVNNNKLELNSFRLFRSNYVVNNLEDSSSVLDLGSGDGLSVNYQQKRRPDLKFTLSDFTNEICESLVFKGNIVIKIDLRSVESLTNLPTFDYITAFEVFEHLAEPENILIKLLEISKFGLIFSVPNTGYFAYRIRFLFGKFPVQWRHHPGEHLRYWTLTDMHWWLNGYLEIPRCNYEVIPYNAPFKILNKIYPGLMSKGLLIHLRKVNK